MTPQSVLNWLQIIENKTATKFGGSACAINACGSECFDWNGRRRDWRNFVCVVMPSRNIKIATDGINTTSGNLVRIKSTQRRVIHRHPRVAFARRAQMADAGKR